MNDKNKSICGAIKFLKISAVSTMLLSLGSTYAFNLDNAQAKTNDDNSNSNDAPSFVITPGQSWDGRTPEQKEKSKESDAKEAHDQLIEKYMAKIETDRPPVKDAKIKEYTNIDYKDYVKDGKLYEYYKVYWTNTDIVIYVGIPVRPASSFDVTLYSKSGNHIDSKAKLNSIQKRIIATLEKSKYKNKYRYIALYRGDYSTKATFLHIIPNSGKSAYYELDNYHDFSYDSLNNLTLPNFKNGKIHENNIKIAYGLNILTHKATLKEWTKALDGGYNKLIQGYAITGNNIAIKVSK